MQSNASKPKTKAKQIVGAVIILTVIFLLGIICYKTEYSKLYKRYSATLSGNNNEIYLSAVLREDFKTEYEHMKLLNLYFSYKMNAYTLSNMSEKSLDYLVDTYNPEDYEAGSFFIDHDKKISNAFKIDGSVLTEEQIDELIENGTLYDSGIYYVLTEAEGGYFVIAGNVDATAFDNLSLNYPDHSYFFICNKNTGEIIDTNIPDFVSNINGLKEENPSLCLSDKADTETVALIRYHGKKILSVIKNTEINGRPLCICSVTDFRVIEKDSLVIAAFTAFLALIFAFLVYYSVYRLKKVVAAGKQQFCEIRIGKKWTTDKALFGNLLVAAVLLGLFILFVAFIVFSLNEISQFNSSSTAALLNITAAVDGYKNNVDIIYSETYNARKKLAYNIAAALQYEYISDKDKLIREIAEIVDAKEISVYDRNGVIQYSTTPYKGYQLSENEDVPRAQLWDLIKGGASDICLASDNSTLVDFAVRRYDEVGILLLTLDLENIDSIIRKLSYSEFIKQQDFPDSDKMYSMRSEPGKMYIIKDGTVSVKQADNELPMSEEKDSYLGIKRIQSKSYIINLVGDEEAVTVMGLPTSEVILNITLYVFFCLAIYILIFVIITVTQARISSAELSVTESGDISNGSIELERKHLLSLVFPITTVFTLLFIVFLFINYQEVINFSYLYNNWEKGFNLISIALILFLLGVSIGIISFSSGINIMLSKVLSPKAATVSSLVCSCVKTVVIVSFALNALEQLGVNTTVITAGLGLTGLAVGIGSKDIINDLVAGIFIIFEGQIQVGDYLEVGNFYGRVVSMGIRTTKLQYFNRELILNNSNMKNITNLSRGGAVVYLQFTFPFGSDLQLISKIASDSEERVREATNGKVSSRVTCLGVDDVTDLGMTCSFIAKVDESNRKSATRKCRSVLLQAFSEHGICPVRKTDITVASGNPDELTGENP